MDQRESQLLPHLSRAIRDRLAEQGSSLRQISIATNHGPGWLSEMLNPERSPPLTIAAIEQVAKYLDLDPRELIWQAFPDPRTSDDPRSLLRAVEPTAPNGMIDSEIASQVGELLKRPLHVTNVDPSIDLDLVETLADSVWRDRSTAYQFAYFHMEELFSKPRKVHTLTVALALFSEILRTTRTSDTYFRSRLIARAYGLARKYPNPQARAYIDERAAYLIWNSLPDPALVSRILESPRMLRHPLKIRLFTARSAFQHILGNHDLALEHLDLARNLPCSNPILRSLVHNMIASAHMHKGEIPEAQGAIEEALKVSNVPDDVVYNHLAVQAKLFLLAGENQRAVEVLVDILHSPYLSRWPDKAAYVALDLFEAGRAVGYRYTQATLERLIRLHGALLADHPVEDELKISLQRGIAAASSGVTTAIHRSLGDPNG